MNTVKTDPVALTLKGTLLHAEAILKHKALNDFYIRTPQGRVCQIRPTRDRVTVVSTEPENPQMGYRVSASDLSSDNLPTKLVNMATVVAQLLPPARPTPEKRLQAWLIGQALQNRRELPLPMPNGIKRLLFLVDELVIQDKPGNKGSRRGDLVGVVVDSHDELRLAFIELKSERDSAVMAGTATKAGKPIVSQLAVMHQAFFHHAAAESRRKALMDLAEVLLAPVPGSLKWAPNVGMNALGVVVWPQEASKNRKTPTDVAGCEDIRIHVIGYREWSFKAELPVQGNL